MSENLKSKAQKGVFWSAIERFSTQGIQFLFSIILARLLSPEDYGIIAMPLIFLAVAQVFIDSGFANALIRKPDLDEKDLSTALIFNVGVGLVCYLILFFASPHISDFYATPILADILKVTSLSILFTPLCTVQQAILTKSLNFKLQARVSVISAITGGVVGVYMAYNGYGVWSLAVSQALTALMRVVLLWSWTKWYPHSGWDKSSFSYLWGYGSKLLFAGLIDTIYQNVYPLIIGKFYSAASLGYYTRAQQFAHLPTVNVYGIIRRVTFPLLSEIQNDRDRLAKVFVRILRVSVYIMFPLMCFIAGSAKPIIIILLSEKWADAIIFLQLLSFAMMWRPIDSLNLNLLTITARTDLFLRLEVIKKVLGIFILFATIKWGVMAICLGYVVYSLSEIVIDSYYSGRSYSLGLFKQLRSIAPIMIMSGIILLSNLTTCYFIGNNYAALILNLLLTLAIVIGLSKVMKLEEINELFAIIKRIRK